MIIHVPTKSESVIHFHHNCGMYVFCQQVYKARQDTKYASAMDS